MDKLIRTGLARISLLVLFLAVFSPGNAGAADWLPPSCNNGVFSGCALTDQPTCEHYGDPANGVGTVQMWGICYNICSTSNPSNYCQGNTLRPLLCGSMSVDKTTLDPGGTITLTSKTKTSVKVKKFMFAFYNSDNVDPQTGPKLISFGGQSYTPIVELTEAQAQASKTFNFADLSQPDANWGGKIPEHIQVNGYFIDDQGNQSIADKVCNVSFTLVAAPVAPTPTPQAVISTPTAAPTPLTTSVPTPTAAASFVPTSAPTTAPVTIASVNFNGAALDLTGANQTAFTLANGVNNNYDTLLDVVDSSGVTRHLVIRFILQSSSTPAPVVNATATPTPTSTPRPTGSGPVNTQISTPPLVESDGAYWTLAPGANGFVSGSLFDAWKDKPNHPPYSGLDAYAFDPVKNQYVLIRGSYVWIYKNNTFIHSVPGDNTAILTISQFWKGYNPAPPADGIDSLAYDHKGVAYMFKGANYWILNPNGTSSSGTLESLWSNIPNHPPTAGIDTVAITPDGNWIITKDGNYWVTQAGSNVFQMGTLADKWGSLGNPPPFEGIGTQVVRPDGGFIITKKYQKAATIDMTNYWPLRPGALWTYKGIVRGGHYGQVSDAAFETHIQVDPMETFCGRQVYPVRFTKDHTYGWWLPGENNNLRWMINTDFLKEKNNWSNDFLFASGGKNYTRNPENPEADPADPFGNVGKFKSYVSYISDDPENYPAYILYPKILNPSWIFEGNQIQPGSIVDNNDCSTVSGDRNSARYDGWRLFYNVVDVSTPAYSGPAVKVTFYEYTLPFSQYPNDKVGMTREFVLLREDWYFAKNVGVVQLEAKRWRYGVEGYEFPYPWSDYSKLYIENPDISLKLNSFNLNSVSAGTVSATFNGSALDITGTSQTTTTLTNGSGSNYDTVVDVTDANGNIRHLVVRFIYQPNAVTTPGTSTGNSGGLVDPKFDLNNDGQINSLDVSIFLSNWSKSLQGEKFSQGDFNGDGLVNNIDYSSLVNLLGKKTR